MKPRIIQPGETRYGVLMSEGEAIDLVSGWVPHTLRARILALLDQEREQARMQASRPMEPSRDRGPTKRSPKKRKKVLRAEAGERLLATAGSTAKFATGDK